MLQTKELVKIYKPKKGVPVTALNKVSVKFPDNGMIFLLGKSGSGKSTLLNLLGGLDSYDSGEIIIKGVSSKDFKQSHFDSYRNTYVGFIFQEYNVLEEFTVGANIALAIQLQGRKATDSEINEILKEVDLEGYGNRKPNELSGGQKQRIAIARALVKKPEIIMADEPTGALDSNTGKAIFDTLKKLSKDKLVLVVSHDRDFAEQYADRIIELADGSVISDMELDGSIEADEGGISFNENTVEVPKGYYLTEKDRKAINDYIDALNSNLDIKIAKKKARTGFVKTDDSKIKDRDGSKFELIKSKLPLKNAFKIGANGLKHKKFRLVMTVLLSCIAFGLFGVSDTFAAYNHIETCTNSLYDSDINYLSIQKAKKADGDNNYHNWGYKLSNEDLNTFKADTGVNVYGIFVPEGEELSINQNIDTSVKLTENLDIYVPRLSGYGTINKQIADELGFTEVPMTLDDWYELLTAVKEAYPDMIPFNCNAPFEYGIDDLGTFGHAFGIRSNMAVRNRWYLADDGSLVYQAESDEMKAFVTEMNKWYEEGLIGFTAGGDNRSGLPLAGKVFAGETGAWGLEQNIASLRESDPDAVFYAAPFPTTDGYEPTYMGRKWWEGSWYLGNNGDEQSRAAAQFLDFAFFSEYGRVSQTLGIMGDGRWYFDENGEVVTTDEFIQGYLYDKTIVPGHEVGDTWYQTPYVITPVQMFNDRLAEEKDKALKESFEAYGDYAAVEEAAYNSVVQANLINAERMTDSFPSRPIKEEDQDTWDMYKSELYTYSTQMISAFIIGDEDLSEWDTYVQTLYDTYNLEEMYKIVERTLDME